MSCLLVLKYNLVLGGKYEKLNLFFSFFFFLKITWTIQLFRSYL